MKAPAPVSAGGPCASPLGGSWQALLGKEFQKPYMQDLRAFLSKQIQAQKKIYPPAHLFFNAFHQVSFENVKVVLLGQDPYHGYRQAHGMCFSVPYGTPPPPSLKNIFLELKSDMGISPPRHGCLNSWAREGVLLLNSTLTVEAGKAGSHQNQGWEIFTDRVIDLLNTQRKSLVFMLWGRHARDKGQFIDSEKHLVLTAAHPSPFSAERGFFHCGHFSKANAYLRQKGGTAINWSLPDRDPDRKSPPLSPLKQEAPL